MSKSNHSSPAHLVSTLGSDPGGQEFHGSFSSSSAVIIPATISALSGDNVTWAGTGNSIRLDAGGDAAIANGPSDWSGGTLTVQRSGGAVTSDVVDLDTTGALFTVSGANLQSAGQTFATFTKTGGTLAISFTSSGTPATVPLVQDVIRHVSYGSDTPGGNATVRFELTHASNAATADVTVASNTIYVTNATDTATVDPSDGVSLSEALATAANQGGNNTIVLADSLAGSTISLAADATVPNGTTLSLPGSGTVTITGHELALGSQFAASVGNGGRLIVDSKLSGSFEKTGAGTLELGGAGNSTGSVTVSAGELAVKNGSAISDSSAVTVASGATLSLGANETLGSLAGAGTVNLGSYDLNGGGDNTSTTFSGVISGSGSLMKSGTGTLSLTGNNDYTGATFVTSGTLESNRVGGAISDSSAVTVASGATLQLSQGETIGSLAGGGTVNLGSYVLTAGGNGSSTEFSGLLMGTSQLVKMGSGSLKLSGVDNSANFTGSTSVQAGSLSVGNYTQVGSGSITMANGTQLTLTGGNFSNSVIFTGNVTVNATASATLSGQLNNSAHNLSKTGSGALTFSGSAYFNNVTVGEGAIVVNNALSSNAVTVNSGGKLGGSGTVQLNGGLLTVASGGTLAPGDNSAGPSVGRLRIQGDLTINAGGTLSVNIDSTQYDVLEAEGAVNIAGANLAVSLGYTPTLGQSYALLDKYDGGTTITGTFGALADNATTTVNGTLLQASYSGGSDNNDFTLTTVAPPAPAPAPDPGPTAPPPTTVDGVPVTTTPGANGSSTTTVPVVPASRPENSGTPNSTLADIPLVKDAAGQSLLQVGLPTGVGLTAEGPSATVTGAAAQADLTQRIDKLAGTGSDLGSQAQAFLAALGSSTPLTVQTITPTTGAGFSPGTPLVITGGAGNQAVVVDARSLPSGTIIQVDNVEFIAIVGAVRVIGGAGQNMATGDGAVQWIVLGPDDDIIHGGAGNDVVGSEAGDDQVYGDAGDDTVFGGAGNDLLSGGTGSDRLNGGTGFDVAIQEGARSDYTVTLDGAGIKLTHTASGVSDWLVDVEQVRFATGPSLTVAHSAAEEAGAYLFQKWLGRDLTQSEGAIIQTLAGQSAEQVATLFAQLFPTQAAGKTTAQLLDGMAAAGAIRVDAVRDVIVNGDAGNNTITPTLGLARFVDGGAGIDTVVIPATLAQTFVQANGNGNFTLQRLTDGAMLDTTRVERVTFSDTRLALDLSGNAGQAAKLLGALAGPGALSNKGLVGEVIRLLDAGASSQTVAGLGLQLLGANTPTQVAQTLWTNVVGRAGTDGELKLLTDIMAGGVSASELVVMAANLELNATRIDLVGLSATGIEFA